VLATPIECMDNVLWTCFSDPSNAISFKTFGTHSRRRTMADETKPHLRKPLISLISCGQTDLTVRFDSSTSTSEENASIYAESTVLLSCLMYVISLR